MLVLLTWLSVIYHVTLGSWTDLDYSQYGRSAQPMFPSTIPQFIVQVLSSHDLVSSSCVRSDWGLWESGRIVNTTSSWPRNNKVHDISWSAALMGWVPVTYSGLQDRSWLNWVSLKTITFANNIADKCLGNYIERLSWTQYQGMEIASKVEWR